MERATMRMYRTWMQHKANPLHIYCRLIDLGLNTEMSKRLGILYETYLYSSRFKGFMTKWKSLKKKFLSSA
ncbi:MAG: hypothetical protein PVG99_10615 [Desulfobacteraceae bacterium]